MRLISLILGLLLQQELCAEILVRAGDAGLPLPSPYLSAETENVLRVYEPFHGDLGVTESGASAQSSGEFIRDSNRSGFSAATSARAQAGLSAYAVALGNYLVTADEPFILFLDLTGAFSSPKDSLIELYVRDRSVSYNTYIARSRIGLTTGSMAEVTSLRGTFELGPGAYEISGYTTSRVISEPGDTSRTVTSSFSGSFEARPVPEPALSLLLLFGFVPLSSRRIRHCF
jgi:hypothetical protein